MVVYEEKEMLTTWKFKSQIKCDVCQGIIVEKGKKPRYYYTVTTGHNEWGNDSADSVINKDVCSDDCLKKLFNEYINKQVKEYKTAYFEVEREFGQCKV